MYVDSLRLTNFRNYEQLDFYPSSELNVLVGANAQGKSAVLEAIYLLATSKSHRTSRDSDMIRIGENIARAQAEIKRSRRNDVVLEIVLSTQEKKTVKINTVKHPKIGDIVGQLNAVIFSSTDVDMVKGDPARRRRFLNLEVSQVSPQYVYALGRYKRVLDQRNNLLREIKAGVAGANGLEAWNSQLAAYGGMVTAKRAEFVSFLSNTATRIYSMLTDSTEKLDVVYKSSLDFKPGTSEQEITETFAAVLSRKKDFDISRATTTTGPHRDDIAININGMPAREFASQGQQRSAAIALKLAEIKLMEQYTGEPPVVLLDDVMGELDETRRARIFDITLGRCQTMVTTAHSSEINPDILSRAHVFEVRGGKVTPK